VRILYRTRRGREVVSSDEELRERVIFRRTIGRPEEDSRGEYASGVEQPFLGGFRDAGVFDYAEDRGQNGCADVV